MFVVLIRIDYCSILVRVSFVAKKSMHVKQLSKSHLS